MHVHVDVQTADWAHLNLLLKGGEAIKFSWTPEMRRFIQAAIIIIPVTYWYLHVTTITNQRKHLLSLVPRSQPQKEERVWYNIKSGMYTSNAFGAHRMQHASHMQQWLAWCHMIITCKPHGVNLIGITEFRNATSASPRKRTLSSFWGWDLGMILASAKKHMDSRTWLCNAHDF